MSQAEKKAEEIIELINRGESVGVVRAKVSSTSDEWHRYSSKAYSVLLDSEGKRRKAIVKKPHVSATSNEDISLVLSLNETLANYGLLLPVLATAPELRYINNLSADLPNSESKIVEVIGNMTMYPKIRVAQKKGRFQKFDYFKVFSRLVDAATLSYYRTNFISSYLTLLPVIEGIIIRWMGYAEVDKKPEFEDIRRFFKNSHQRQPCPSNILFHNVYIKACDKILNEHFYRPTDTGNSYANFNRHVASHLLKDSEFATKANCIRLYILIDAMTEIFLYESKQNDPRFYLTHNDTDIEVGYFANALLDNVNSTPEHLILGTNMDDLGDRLNPLKKI